MRATIRDFKTAVKRPQNIIAAVIVVAASTIAVSQFGYLVWRRFVVPAEIMFTALIVWRIARHINQPAFRRVMSIASTGLAVGATAIIIGAFIDGVMFPETGYCTFVLVVLLWWWINFQASRIEKRFASLTPTEKSVITQNTASFMAHLEYRREAIGDTLNDYSDTVERLGLKNYLTIH